MSDVLIIGSGYVGNNLYNCLLGRSYKTHIVSRSVLDYGDRTVLAKYILNNNIGYVINCSGFTGKPNVDECELQPAKTWDLNVVVPSIVSAVCNTLGIGYIHVSSGCIYSGYDQQWTEEDVPNFGLFSKSSTYSKSKHAFETISNYGCLLRIRMPFCDDYSQRSYLTKIHNYNNIIDFVNSKTYIADLCDFIKYLIESRVNLTSIGKLNFVNPGALSTLEVIRRMEIFGVTNKNWKVVDIDALNIAAPRSNCVLSIEKLQRLFPDFILQSEESALDCALSNIII